MNNFGRRMFVRLVFGLIVKLLQVEYVFLEHFCQLHMLYAMKKSTEKYRQTNARVLLCCTKIWQLTIE